MHKIKLKNSDNMDVAREYPDYRFHVTDSIIFTSDRKMLASLVVAGIPFETENDNVLTNFGFAPIFPDTCYHLTHYWPAAVDIPVASDNPVH
ncbi:hypothetical protein ACM91G_22360, partial [Escherichia coli]